ncbi:hypothetical protein [Flavobacterium sp.]|uniref:hypothetical protein n=1 Tax=Flavobacterium sp. TaxID=239 RepID=UPI0028BD4FCF|nr:hypothetical protein [Flavobacterium sp.]
MKLESLELEKFNGDTLKKEQMFKLNGGGTVTPAGTGCGTGTSASNPNTVYYYDYGYDAIRTNSDGSTYTTYHNRTNVRIISAAECNGMQNG